MYLYILKYDIKRMRMELHNCDKMHKTIMRMFKSNRKEEGVLFYNDEKDQVIFLQSINKPNIEVCTGFSVVHSEEINYDECIKDDEIDIEIHVNPVKTDVIKSKEKNSSRKMLITDSYEKENWVMRKMLESGATVKKIYKEIQTSCYIAKDGVKSRELGISTFILRVRIDDRDKFIEACKNGIGQQKSYGSGLMLPFVIL